jgi:alanine dehydrogenase
MPALVARTASYGLNNAVLDYVHDIADNGLTPALMADEGLAKGVCAYNGYCTNESIAESFEVNYKKLHIFSTN